MTVKTEPLKELRRGPGGHWLRYVAMNEPDNGKRGYGDTRREAEHDLRQQESSNAQG
jgi:hypothetical protein